MIVPNADAPKDAFGLLYRIGSVLSSHGCNIEVALIATEGQKAIDVFYLTREGGKLSTETEKTIEVQLLEALSEA